MTAMIESLGAVAQPWADLYADSGTLATLVVFLHLGGLTVAGGFALAFDRSALRVGRGVVADRSAFLRELNAVHVPVILAMTIVIASGFALMLADVEVFLPSKVFWLKMGVFGLLLLNGIAVQAAGRRLSRDTMDARGWTRLRRASLRSIGLWTAVIFLGVLLTVAA
jgi:hypothetical protein